MKRVRVNLNKVGIVYRRGDYDRLLTVGTYWLGMNEEIVFYEKDSIYNSFEEMDILLQDKHFKANTEVIEVNDDEIVLQYERMNFKLLLEPGRYFFFKGYKEISFVKVNLNEAENTMKVKQSVMRETTVIPYRYEFKIESSEEGLLFINGEFVKRLTKGLYFFWKNVVPIEVVKIDMRQIQLEISGQEMLTKDKAALRINFQASYRVVDAKKALLENKDFERQLYTLLQLALREFVGTLTLDELLGAKEKVSGFVIQSLNAKVKNLGVELLSAGIRDIVLPGEVKDIMNKVLIAQKNAEANTISRREETASTRNLLNTAKLMEDNNMLYKLKEMEYLEKIADKIGEVTVSNGGQVIDQLTQIFAK